jgi:anti-sigma B factor antagonist
MDPSPAENGLSVLSALVDRRNGQLVLRCVGEADLSTRDDLRDALAPLTGVVMVDLSNVTFLDASAISVLVAQRNRLIAQNGDLRLSAPNHMIRNTLNLVGMAEWINDRPCGGSSFQTRAEPPLRRARPNARVRGEPVIPAPEKLPSLNRPA